MNHLLLTLLACLLLTAIHSQQQPTPNQNCAWRGYKTCPIESSGSSPICDSTNPIQVSPGVYGIKICAAQTPKFVGGKFEVGLALFGQILTVDVIPADPAENNQNCSDGSSSAGLRVFSAHCQVSGPGKIRGYWAVTYKNGTSLSTQ